MGILIDDPFPIFKTPLPVAVSDRLALLGLITKPALELFTAIFAFTFTLFVAVKVRVVFAFQLTPSLIFILPEPDCEPDALCSVTLVVPRLVESWVPV